VITAADIAMLRRIADELTPTELPSPSAWAQEFIRFSGAGAPVHGALDLELSPFLREPLEAWRTEPGQGLKEITVVAPEQMGKTTLEFSGLLWRLRHRPGLTMIIYPSDEKGVRVNEEKLEPMMREIPYFAELLDRPMSKTLDCYRLGGSLVYFGGAGSRATSHSAVAVLADEVDDWQSIKGVDQMNDLRKRSRAFGEAVLCAVCTPRMGENASRIWKEFRNSSQGFWHLRCCGCGALTMRSADVRNLQWEVDENGNVVAGSIRLICPACGHEHLEADKRRMNLAGGYIHKHPERLREHPGFQFGALASQFTALRWEVIAAAGLKAGRSGDISDQIYFDNSIRGLPFTPRRLDNRGVEAVKKHRAPLPEPSSILYRFLAVDTQDAGFFWVVRGLDAKMNTYLLGAGMAADTAALAEVWNAEYHGGKLTCGIIDEGGHRMAEVRQFADDRTGLFTYKGNGRIGTRLKESKEVPGLILANAETYKQFLLYAIYGTPNRGSHYWYLPPEPSEMYMEQITSWRPNKAVRNGDAIENYHCPDGTPDHLFDCEKMMLALVEYFGDRILPMLVAKRRKAAVKRV